MKRLLWLLLLLPALALGQEVGSYPNATSPLTGSERILADQSVTYPCVSCTVNLTPAQLANFVASQVTPFALLYNNNGVIGGVIPGTTGQYCLQWTSLSAAPTLVTCSSGGSGTVASGTTNQVGCYLANGTTISGCTTLPTAAMPAVSGDVTIPAGTTTATVSKVNGASFPTSATVVGSNSSAQPIAASTTGSGSVVLASAPTIANLTVTGTCTGCGSGGSITLQTNGTNNASQTTLNLVGTGGVAVTNPTGGTVDIGPVSESVNAQTGTTYTVASTDCGKQITFSNASAIAVTVPQATGSFASCQFDVTDLGSGTATLTPTTSTINGSASLAIAQNRQCTVNSDGTNWQVIGCTALVSSGGGGTSVTPYGFTFSNVAQATTTGLSAGYVNSTNVTGAIAPTSMTIKNLYTYTQNSVAAGQTFVYTLLVGTPGGTLNATSLTCTVSSGHTCSDTTDSATVTAGQQWVIQLVTSATSGSTGVGMIGIELDH